MPAGLDGRRRRQSDLRRGTDKSDAIGACSRVIAAPRTSAHDRTMALTFAAMPGAARGQWRSDSRLQPGADAAARLPGGARRPRHRLSRDERSDPRDRRLRPGHQARSKRCQGVSTQRGVAKSKAGDAAGSDADIAAAKAINPALPVSSDHRTSPTDIGLRKQRHLIEPVAPESRASGSCSALPARRRPWSDCRASRR